MIILTSLKFINIARYRYHMLQLCLVPPLSIKATLKWIPISPCTQHKNIASLHLKWVQLFFFFLVRCPHCILSYIYYLGFHEIGEREQLHLVVFPKYVCCIFSSYSLSWWRNHVFLTHFSLILILLHAILWYQDTFTRNKFNIRFRKKI